MATPGKQWFVGEDGCVTVGEPSNSVAYHSSLNSIIVTTDEPTVKIYDVTSGSVLQKSNLSGRSSKKMKMQFHDWQWLEVRIRTPSLGG